MRTLFLVLAVIAFLAIVVSSPALAGDSVSGALRAGPMLGISTTLTPVADSYVSSAYPTANYGTQTQIRVDGSPTIRSFLRFNVSGLSGISKATLRIYANTALSSGYVVNRVLYDGWGETTVNHSNAPAVGSAIGSSGPVIAGQWAAVDVTSFVTGTGMWSFALTSSNGTALSLASREAANKPQLVITTGSAPGPTSTPAPRPTATPASGGSAILLATGDTRSGCTSQAYAVGDIIERYRGVPFLHSGDMVNTGALGEFSNCYNAAFGGVKAQTKPVPGNHEYGTSGASGYWDYFGSLAGTRGQGYYSFNYNGWHIVNINSEVSVASGSAQYNWLKNDLAANPSKCTMAQWHRPRFSSGEHGPSTDLGAMYTLLYNAGVEVLVSGHDHDYERFAPQNPSGVRDDARGVRQFVIGTGGVAQRAFGTIRANSQVRNNSTWGVMKFTLQSDRYSWQFLPIAGQTWSDSGTTLCH